MENTELELAQDFILETEKNVFLTGKAGTGKTTFLKKFLKVLDKNYVVLAPTGVAAINAGGMTIHSFFGLPTTTFIPTYELVDPSSITNRTALGRHMRYNKDKLRLIRELETIVIDEISMVRADILDAIDFILQHVRRSNLPFGGIQVVAIGDLYQLPPVIKQDDWIYLSRYYKSGFFFDSNVWTKADAIYVELKKVYRQKDQKFVDLLNGIRNGEKSAAHIEIINQLVNPLFNNQEDGFITLTTHVSKAEEINRNHLSKINNKSCWFEADVSGTFSEYAYPTESKLELKVGAQVMFIKNDADGLYFNGKIGIISKIDKESIMVISDDQSIKVSKVAWRNVKYNLEGEKVKEEEIGSFSQIPLRLAWAVTVHKSQGLTFDKVILDLKDTFAPGQLYVALSRCRQIDGIILTAPISAHNIITDQRIVNYLSQMTISNSQLSVHLADAKNKYQYKLLLKTFDFNKLLAEAMEWKEYTEEHSLKYVKTSIIDDTIKSLELLVEVSLKFHHQIFSLDLSSKEAIIERCIKAIQYFTDSIYDHVILNLFDHINDVKYKPKQKKYFDLISEFYFLAWNKLNKLYELKIDNNLIYSGSRYLKQNLDKVSEVKKNSGKGSTFEDTLILFNDGKDAKEIAEIRGMSVSTIEGHLSKWLKQGKIDIYRLIPKERFDQIVSFTKGIDGLNDLKSKVPFDTTYEELRYVISYLAFHQES